MAGKKNKFRTFPKIELTFAGARKDFMSMKKARGLSESTIQSYESNLKPFFRFLEEREIERVKAFSESNFNDFRIWLLKPERSETTVNTYLRNTRVFLYYLMRQVKELEPFDIHLNPQGRVYKDVYTDEEIGKLIKEADLRNFEEHRNWMMVCFFLETGVRLKTLLHLKVGDVDLETRMVRLTTTKNRKQQTVPIGSVIAHRIRKYVRDWKLQENEPLFPSHVGERMKEDSAKHAIARYNRSRGVERTSIHAFRHTFARNYIITGGDAFKLQQHLGHSSITMTLQYVNLFGTDLLKGFEEHSLIEKMTPKKIKDRKKVG